MMRLMLMMEMMNMVMIVIMVMMKMVIMVMVVMMKMVMMVRMVLMKMVMMKMVVMRKMNTLHPPRLSTSGSLTLSHFSMAAPVYHRNDDHFNKY